LTNNTKLFYVFFGNLVIGVELEDPEKYSFGLGELSVL